MLHWPDPWFPPINLWNVPHQGAAMTDTSKIPTLLDEAMRDAQQTVDLDRLTYFESNDNDYWSHWLSKLEPWPLTEAEIDLMRALANRLDNLPAPSAEMLAGMARCADFLRVLAGRDRIAPRPRAQSTPVRPSHRDRAIEYTP